MLHKTNQTAKDKQAVVVRVIHQDRTVSPTSAPTNILFNFVTNYLPSIFTQNKEMPLWFLSDEKNPGRRKRSMASAVQTF
jgi:hypothetical protein